MNEVLDIANEVIEEDKELANKTTYPATVTYTGNDDDLIDDYKVARDTLKSLISSGQFALQKMEKVLQDSDKPRNFEVFATLMTSISNLTGDLIDLQKKMKDIIAPLPDGGTGKEDDDGIYITSDQLNKLLDTAADDKK